ncbi:Single-stranded DNA-binding protein WHY2-mitochondrial [Striga hermonthica]|uniref:Single-stranded DNA-binding protein WHY2-mitochondrial n=1 Tax=Striga hermonthica TaxID=68872 RepID=A0A9N7MJ37_STRHE|nr:Single-stranded DNA-binding protein WHY2-mitochondrial [Striga hermonthica]
MCFTTQDTHPPHRVAPGHSLVFLQSPNRPPHELIYKAAPSSSWDDKFILASELFSLKSLASAAASDLRLSRSITTQTGIASAMPKFGHDGKPMARTFAPYSIFKGKAALSADPSLPMFTKLEILTLFLYAHLLLSGDYRVERRGSIMLTFRPAIGERKYDWEKKQMFALSVTEVGSLISLGAKRLL